MAHAHEIRFAGFPDEAMEEWSTQQTMPPY